MKTRRERETPYRWLAGARDIRASRPNGRRRLRPGGTTKGCRAGPSIITKGAHMRSQKIDGYKVAGRVAVALSAMAIGVALHMLYRLAWLVL
jgi:hypothetical protein